MFSAPARIRKAAEWISPEVNAEGLVLGTLMIASLLAAESVRSETYPDTASAVTILLVLYWLSRSYADALEIRIEGELRWTPQIFFGSLRRQLAILRGGLVPLICLLLCWAGGVSLNTGVAIAILSAGATLVVLEAAAGIRSSEGTMGILADILVGALLGLGVFVLKVVLH
ncbi:MAG TPA: hypothetical protein VEJ87_05545 [Acidimicrobiales bacterium]|nr:hypothetical protein [Acidimicrobiales bacterium]